MHAAGGQAQEGFAVDDDLVTRIGVSPPGFETKRDPGNADVVDDAGLLFDAVDAALGVDDGPVALRDAASQSRGGGDEGRTLPQAAVQEATRSHAPLEGSNAEANADLVLKGKSSRGRVLGPHHADRVDARGDGRQEHREGVHEKARVDAGADDAAAGGSGFSIEGRRELWVVLPGPHQLLAGRHHVQAAAQTGPHRRREARQRRGGADHRDVTACKSDVGEIRAHREPSDVEALLGRVDVDDPDQTQIGAGSDVDGDGGTDGSGADDDDAGGGGRLLGNHGPDDAPSASRFEQGRSGPLLPSAANALQRFVVGVAGGLNESMHTILVADDSVTIQRAVEIVFDKEPFTVVKVGSGQEAINRARELQPHIVLADHTLADITGYDLAAALRADPHTQSIPVLLLSAASNPFDEARAQAAGVVGHLPKPFDCQSLLDRVRTILGVAATAPGTFASTAPPPATLGSSLPRPPASAAGLPRPPGPLGGMPPAPRPIPPMAPVPAFAGSAAPAAVPVVPIPAAASARPPVREADPFGFGQALSSTSTASTSSPAAPMPAAPVAAAVAVSTFGTLGGPLRNPLPPAPAPAALSSPQSMSTPVVTSGWQSMNPGVGLSSPPPSPAPLPPAAAPLSKPAWIPAPVVPVARAAHDLLEISDLDVGDVAPLRPLPPLPPLPAEPTMPAPTPVSAPAPALSLAPAPAAPSGNGHAAAAVLPVDRLTQAVEAVVATAAPALAQSAGAPPSHELLTQEARSIVERIAWEVVPELAELIIREEIQRLLKAK